MRKAILYISSALLALVFSSCGKEHFTNSTEIAIWNYDSIPMDIYVNGTKAVSFDKFWGEVHLLSGDYEIAAKSGDKEIDKVSVSLSKQSEDNEHHRFVFIPGKKKDFALMDMGDLYDDGTKLGVEEKFFGVNFLRLEYNTYRIYWPWSTLPFKLYDTEGSDPTIFQLFDLPAGYENKSDAEIEAFCFSLVE